MNELIKVENKNGNLYVSSRVIAKELKKRHGDVLESLDKILTNGDFRSLIITNNYVDKKGENRREYLLTKDGFILYMFNIQGYNDLKMAYIKKFNEMEQALRNRENTDWLMTREQGKLVRRKETDIIQELIIYATEQGSQNASMLYMNYSKLTNKLVGIEPNSRDKIPFKKLIAVHQLEDLFTKIIRDCMNKNMFYKSIYEECKKIGTQFMGYLNYDVKVIRY